MKYYRIYGLNLTVNIALPGLIAIDNLAGDLPIVDVVLGELPSWLSETHPVGTPNWHTRMEESELDRSTSVPLLQVWKLDAPLLVTAPLTAGDPDSSQGTRQSQQRQSDSPLNEYFYCRYDDRTTFVVSRLGTQIWATWPDELTIEDMATYLLGPMLGFVLRLRGTVCLHASAIAIDGRVVVLVGAAGAGKSTTAAAFARAGYPVLSDDVVPLIDRGDTFWVQSAYPRIRLWDSSVQALYGDAEALPRLVPTHPTWDKRYLDLNQAGYQFQSAPLPLAAIYYINDRADDPACPQIAPMTTQDRLITLVTNTYTNYLLDKQLRAQEFEILSRVVAYIPVRQLTPHTDIGRLVETIELLIADFRQHRSAV
ncbi:hypothetical protein [Chamaesiphon sp.]|uniref:hypothetical protein n=1 Tax=Chamaesiphon sp. TaxID=2814140 RepID=UPI0035942D7E